jgi:hypothetical protein
MRRSLLAAALAVAAFAIPASASADSGLISDLRVEGGALLGTVAVSGEGCPKRSLVPCGWFGFVQAIPAAAPCDPGAGQPGWTGEARTDSRTENGTVIVPLDDAAPVRLCLFVYRPEAPDRLVFETVFDPPDELVAAAAQPPPPIVVPDPCGIWARQMLRREREHRDARGAYRRLRTPARLRAMRLALDKLETARSMVRQHCA